MIAQSNGIALSVYVIVFVGALLAFEGIRQLLSRSETRGEARNRRMKWVRDGATSEKILQELFYAETRSGRRRFGLPDLGRRLRQAGLRINPPVFLLSGLLCGVAVFLLAQHRMDERIALVFGVGIGLLGPMAVLSHARDKRMKKLVSQLPDALDMMARGLKVGHPLNVTVASVAREMADPIGTEFGLIEDQVSFGTEIADAFADFAERTDQEDARSLAVSVGIQHGTGGNLGRVLSVLSTVIRDRATMRRKITAISAEGRLSAVILSALPFGIFASIHFTTPSYYGDVMGEPAFLPVAGIIVTLVVVQALILRRLVTFKF
jgi:tight adherence protein B